MDRGLKISLGMHVGLILAVLLAESLAPPRLERLPDTTEVALISASDFAAMTAPQREETASESATPTPTPTPAPKAVDRPEAPTASDDDGSADRQQAAVIDDTPSPPDASLRPVQRQADRVAPEAIPEPDPEAQIERRDQAALEPDEPVEVPESAVPEQQATAREAAATETVTEATEIDESAAPRRTATAPEVSLRPARRPERRPTPPEPEPESEPVPERAAAQPSPEPEPERPSASAIEDALLAALDDPVDTPSPRHDTPVAGALSQADIDMLRLSVEECWNVGRLSTEAMQVVVTIGFEMTRESRPVAESIRLVEATGASAHAQNAAFEVGRAAINECGRHGFGLPSDLYDQWKEVEITFNPARMSVR